MIKKTVTLICILFILFLTSCAVDGLIADMPDKDNNSSSNLFENSKTDMLNESTNDRKTDVRLEQILSIINEKDKEAMETSFSQKALNEVQDFDSQVDYLFGFFQGKVKLWTRNSFNSGKSIDNGKKSLVVRAWYTVETDQEVYLFFIIDYIEDTIDPDNEGLYILRVIRAEDEEKEFAYWQDMEAGIYKPSE